ncbi:MAG: helix-turn-helix domain-containing protein [Phycisphaerales bacterium]|nr:helix-turn-helix domain-containing protein [Phycisphaerales bacterium]
MPRRSRTLSRAARSQGQDARKPLRRISSSGQRGAKDGSTLPLGLLRQALGVTQVQMAGRLQVNQASVSRIERSLDPQVSTIRRFLRGLEARLAMSAIMRDGRVFGVEPKAPDLRRRRRA